MADGGPQKSTYVKDFKWRKHQAFVKQYGRVLARLGDRLWDVAERQSPNTYLKHVGDEVCYGRLAEPQPPCTLAHSGNAAERLRWTQAGLCDGAPEAWRVAPPERAPEEAPSR